MTNRRTMTQGPHSWITSTIATYLIAVWTMTLGLALLLVLGTLLWRCRKSTPAKSGGNLLEPDLRSRHQSS